MKIASASVADLYSLPASDWAAIHQRVNVTQQAQPLMAEIQQLLPHFPDLVTACQQWQSSTFPGIVTQSQRLSDYATWAIQQFTPLAGTIAGLDPAAPLAPDVRARAQTALSGLSAQTTALSQAFDGLKPQISNFCLVNKQVDTEATRYTSQLGFLGESIAQKLHALDNAAGGVLGDWSAISDDLRQLTAPGADLTVDVLLTLELQEALLAWQSIHDEVAGFQRNITSQVAAAAV